VIALSFNQENARHSNKVNLASAPSEELAGGEHASRRCDRGHDQILRHVVGGEPPPKHTRCRIGGVEAERRACHAGPVDDDSCFGFEAVKRIAVRRIRHGDGDARAGRIWIDPR
jgi:hypothetical protein